MSEPIALSGWVLAAAALAAAATTRQILVSRTKAVARACHELRGPLTAARLGLELESRTGQLAEARVRAIELELRRAALALEDLRDAPGSLDALFVRPRSRAVVSQEVDVAELLADSVEAWRAAAAAAGIDLRLAVSGGPAVVVGDRLRLAQATGNLIANAIEHGGGMVEVTVRAEQGRVRVEVVDGGPGLHSPLGELVSGRSRRRAPWRVAGRSRGHGLAIASGVAMAHGGRLAAGPSERGARLVLDLPANAGTSLRAPVRR
jgi:signal transduction histidine kinase